MGQRAEPAAWEQRHGGPWGTGVLEALSRLCALMCSVAGRVSTQGESQCGSRQNRELDSLGSTASRDTGACPNPQEGHWGSPK